MRFLSFLFALALLPSIAAAQNMPIYVKVVDVASDDTLNVRSLPSAKGEILGEIPHDATGIEVLAKDDSGKWAKINWQESHGWMSMRYLQEYDIEKIGSTALPSGILCGGTEPFWSLRLGNQGASYSDISGSVHLMAINGIRVAQGRPFFPLQLGLAGQTAGANAFIRPAQCSDGMSDVDYPYQLDFLISDGQEQTLLEGCCALPLEVGSH